MAAPLNATLLENAEYYLRQTTQGAFTSVYHYGNEVEGTNYRLNCYAFVNHIVGQTSPEAHSELCRKMEEMDSVPVSSDGIPCPFNLFAIFKTLDEQEDKIWQRVPIIDMRPGDILVYQPINYQPPKVPNLNKPTRTHAMIVKEIAKLDACIKLKIIDCTRKPHNKTDTRYPCSSGIGASDLFIMSDNSTNSYRISWYLGRKGWKKELSVGRLVHGSSGNKLSALVNNTSSIRGNDVG